MWLVVIIFSLTTALFIWNRIPMGTVSMLAILALLLCGAISPSEAYGFICNSTTLTMTSMFVLSSALVKTSYIASLTRLAEKVAARSFKGLITSYVLLAFLLSQFIPSITAVFAILCPVIVSMCKKMNIKPRKILYSTALVISVGAYTLTPFGPYAANFIENNNLQIQYGIQGFVNTPFTEMLVKLPPTVFAILWGIFAAPKYKKESGKSSYTPDNDNGIDCGHSSSGSVNDSPTVQDAANTEKNFKDENGLTESNDKASTSSFFTKRGNILNLSAYQAQSLTPFQNISTLLLFSASVISLVISPFNLPNWVIPCVLACIMVCTGTLTEKEAVSGLNLSVIVIYAGTSALGAALVRYGVAEKIGEFVIKALSGTQNGYLVGFVFFAGALVLTSLIYNRATGRILIPIVLSTCYALNLDPRGLVQMCYIGSMCSLLTPASTSLVPMLIENAGYSQRDLLKNGLLPSLLLSAVTVIWGMTLYPPF